MTAIYDADAWEGDVYEWLQIREGYGNVQWINPNAGGTDLGIDHFIRSRSTAYQCYAPQKNYSHKELYEHQYGKIYDDTSKLTGKKYQAKVKKLLQDCKLSRWILAVPVQAGSDIVLYASERAKNIKKMNLDFIADDFEILIQDESSFEKEKLASISRGRSLMNLDSVPIKEAERIQWASKNNTYYQNLVDKLKAAFPDFSDLEVEERVILYLDKFLIRSRHLETISTEHPHVYNALFQAINMREEELKLYNYPANQEGGEILRVEYDSLCKRLQDSNKILGLGTASQLAQGTVSDWLLRCPLKIRPLRAS
ncbi:MAG: hypothetical protein HQL69_22680 [Magnetococcales bacterium]|nr:hypothetical protein [Magnetococcales bacterium]